MKVEGVRRIVNRWPEDETVNTKIITHVQDRDGRRRKLLGKLWTGKQELLDPNHVMKSFDNELNNGPILSGIKQKLRRWFTFLLHLNLSPQEKRAHWKNTILHHEGIHHSCLNHPTIKGPPWAMIPVNLIGDFVQSID
jgi:hypothetical protein